MLGLVIGVATSFALTRLMSGILFGVGATDPLTFGGVSLALFGVALAACLVPARKATRIDPIRASHDVTRAERRATPLAATTRSSPISSS